MSTTPNRLAFFGVVVARYLRLGRWRVKSVGRALSLMPTTRTMTRNNIAAELFWLAVLMAVVYFLVELGS